jgi:hypothetical protein
MMKRRFALGIAALLLFGLAALLAIVGEEGAPHDRRPPPIFPDRMRTKDRDRLQARLTYAPPPVVIPAVLVAQPAAVPAEPRPSKRDPLLLALAPRQGALVLEANALRHARVGELLVACLARQQGDPLARFREETGIDPLKDVDRVALTGHALVVSGFFQNARLDRLGEGVAYGREARLYGEASEVAVWRDQLVVVGEPEEVRGAVDRIEGRAPQAPSPIPEELTYGEAYGVFEGEALSQLFAGSPSDLGRRFGEVAKRVEIHVDAMSNVAATVRIAGDSQGAVRDLSRALAGALALARLEAQRTGDVEAAELLESASVSDGSSGALSMDVAIPASTLERWFASCGKRASP